MENKIQFKDLKDQLNKTASVSSPSIPSIMPEELKQSEKESGEKIQTNKYSYLDELYSSLHDLDSLK